MNRKVTERAVAVAKDWFTIAPKHRTKKRLAELISSHVEAECNKWQDIETAPKAEPVLVFGKLRDAKEFTVFKSFLWIDGTWKIEHDLSGRIIEKVTD